LKKFFVLGLAFSLGDVTSEGIFAYFGQFYPAIGANLMSHFFGSTLFWKVDYHPRL